MCGICGIVKAPEQLGVNKHLLEKMCQVIHHRGPDDDGMYSNEYVGLGHKRLSIIDVEGGQQPITNEDSSVWLVYNGELYNYRPLRSDLIQRGHVFKTQSDTEVILHAYEEYGTECLQHFRGMFAFALYDLKTKTFFAARDRIGIKPFYYTIADNSLIFGSEIKSLIVHPAVARDIDTASLYHYLRLRYVPGPKTIFKNVLKLQPGHFILYRDGELHIKRYWDLCSIEQMDPNEMSISRISEEFDALLEDCVKIRMMSEVPLGAFLSGGLDSSVIVAMMDKHNGGRPVKTFSVGYENDYGVNEFEYAKIVAQKYGTEHYECRISSQNFYDFLPKFVWHLDEPIADSACIPLYFLSSFAKEHVTVILSGEGADEILAGYGIYGKMLTLNSLQKLPKLLRHTLLGGILPMVFRRGKIHKYLELARHPLEKRYKGVSAAFSASQLENDLLSSSFNFEEGVSSVYENYFSKSARQTALNSMMYVDMNTWLPDDLLMKADKMTMAASMELRVPFLDHKMVEFAYSLPEQCKIQKNESKFLLRQLGKKLLPREITARSKKGFPVPISNWFENDLSGVARDVLSDSSSFARTVFSNDTIGKMLLDHGASAVDNSENIWNLLVLEFWYKEFIQGNVGAEEVRSC